MEQVLPTSRITIMIIVIICRSQIEDLSEQVCSLKGQGKMTAKFKLSISILILKTSLRVEVYHNSSTITKNPSASKCTHNYRTKKRRQL